MKTKIKPISFKVNKADAKLITPIVDRAVKLAEKHGIDYDYTECRMDVTACHANGNPLHLSKLLAADDFNFAHDIFGIRRHLNRENAQLMDCFSPRCSL